MNAVLFSFSDKSCRLSIRIAEVLTGIDYTCRPLTLERLAAKYGLDAYGDLPAATGEAFKTDQVIIFVGACGIAVRSIAPWIKDKATDPAILVIDDNGKFVIPILSGHIGGANALSNALADKIGAVPVITTATDINNKFAADTWATVNNLVISDMKAAKAVSAGILHSDIPMKCDFTIKGKLPGGIILSDNGALGIYISYKTNLPFKQTLRLTPRILHIGIGCRKDIDESAIMELLSKVFDSNGWDISAIKTISSIDIKSSEPGLLSACGKIGITPSFYPAEKLMAIAGNFTTSAFVKSITGVDNVCERAAAISSNGGTLILKKTSHNGVTIAIAEENWEAVF